MPNKNTYYIRLDGANYEVRVVGSEREVKFCGMWISTEDFVEALIKHGRWSQLRELAALGAEVLGVAK